MKRIFTLLFFIPSFFFSQIPDYEVAKIDVGLLKNADAVIRLNLMEVYVDSYKSIKVFKTKAVTVFNEEGRHHAAAYQYYDEEQRILNLNAWVYDANGKELEKFKEKDFSDQSATGEGTLYSDSRVKYLRYVPNSYPYTIVFKSSYETSDTAFVPTAYFLNNYGLSVEKSTYTLNLTENTMIRFKENNLEDFGVQSKRTTNQYRYDVENISAMLKEPYAPHFREFAPSVNFALEKFRLKGVDGQARNWEEFGKWIYESLLTDQDFLSEATKIRIRKLVDGIDSPRERVKKVYEYVQANTRYISVQLGIGGWQPISANEVDRVKYGDCKGLTNYTKALLNEIGIESFYTVVYGDYRKRSLLPDFPSLQGNHVFLNVPLDDEEVWLECTSQKAPIDYLANFTDDRYVLKVTPEGGQLVKSKKYDDTDNRLLTTAKIDLHANGNITAEVNMTSSGTQYDRRYRLSDDKEVELEEHYKEYWDYVNNLNIETIDFQNNKDEVEFSEQVAITVKDYIVFAGERWLFAPNMFDRNRYVPKRVRSRKREVLVQRGYLDEDEFIIKLPENAQVEDLLAPVNLKTDFGEYRLEMKMMADHQISYKRKLLVRSGRYSKDEYAAFRDFRKKVARNDNAKIVLIKT